MSSLFVSAMDTSVIGICVVSLGFLVIFVVQGMLGLSVAVFLGLFVSVIFLGSLLLFLSMGWCVVE